MTNEIKDAIVEARNFLGISLLIVFFTLTLLISSRMIYEHFKEKRAEKLPEKEFIIEDDNYQLKIYVLKKTEN